MKNQIRYDVGSGSIAFEQTPQGGLRGPANFTRTGVFKYRNKDGTTRRELRHPDHVFNADSIASLEDAPLTDGHPAVMVTSANYKELAIGHARNARKDAKFLSGTAVVQDGTAVKEVGKSLKGELSCGYNCDLLDEKGTYDGEEYDFVQTNIRYNHVALLPPGGGRAGSEVRLRLDGAAEMVCDSEEPRAKEEFKMDPKEAAKLISETADAIKSAAAEKARADAADAQTKAEKARADKAEGERDAEKDKREKAEKAAKDLQDSIGARVDARVDLQTRAAKLLPKDYVFAGKSDDEIRIAALTKANPKFDAKDKNSDYLAARFDGLDDGQSNVVPSLRTKPARTGAPAPREDADDEREDADDEDDEPEWRKPLGSASVR